MPGGHVATYPDAKEWGYPGLIMVICKCRWTWGPGTYKQAQEAHAQHRKEAAS